MATIVLLSHRMLLNTLPTNPFIMGVRNFKYPPREKMKVFLRRLKKEVNLEQREQRQLLNESFLPPDRKIEFDLQSLATRGFLRSTKPYSPPNNIEEQIKKIASSLSGVKNQGIDLSNSLTKFKFLTKCISEFHHDIPNSQLHKMKSLDDVIEYFKIPVNVTTSYDRLVADSSKEDFPPNLHVQSDYVRFHPETDTLFGGVTAFPESSTIVTGFKAKKKYKGFDSRTYSQKLAKK